MGTESRLKEPKLLEEQVEILKNRNMIIEDEEEAVEVLKKINYYRLTAYAMQFKNDEDDYEKKISFNTMYRLYKFDKSLRHLLLEILEDIEIKVRTYMAYNLSIRYGAEAYKEGDIFKNSKSYLGYDDGNGNHYSGLKDEIEKEIRKNSKELFIQHHKNNYNGCFPFWVIIEIFSFGMVSKTYKNLKTNEQKEIAKKCFNVNYILLESWLGCLTAIRNVCAHYGRLYNKRFAISPKIHSKYHKYNLDERRLFVSILAIKELTKDTSEWGNFKTNLEALIHEYDDVINLRLIGFPNNWEDILSEQ